MSEFYLGKHKFNTPVALAPMAGVTDRAFRMICKSYGADLFVTEMVSAKGMYYNDEKTGVLASIDEGITPCGVQIFGREPDIMAIAANKLLSLDYKGCISKISPDFIDINMGCPVNKIVSNREGSALLREPQLVGEIINKLSTSVDIPITVKIRAGFDDDNLNAPEIAKIAEEAGASMITVHGRTRAGMYHAPVNYDIIRAVKEAVSIPVIGNGGIFSADDALRMITLTGCDGIMIGRGAEGNPFIFEEIKAGLEGREYKEPSAADKVNAALYHTRLLCEYKGEYIGIRESRKHIAWYLKGLHSSSVLRGAVNTVETLFDVEGMLNEYLETLS